MKASVGDILYFPIEDSSNFVVPPPLSQGRACVIVKVLGDQGDDPPYRVRFEGDDATYICMPDRKVLIERHGI